MAARAATVVLEVCWQEHCRAKNLYLLTLVSTFATVLELLRHMPNDVKKSLGTLEALAICINEWAGRVLGCEELGVVPNPPPSQRVTDEDQREFDFFVEKLHAEMEDAVNPIVEWLCNLSANEGARLTHCLAGLEAFARQAPMRGQDQRLMALVVSFSSKIQEMVAKTQMESALQVSPSS